MNICIIGNPETDTSSGKFLGKFLSMISGSVDRIYVLNDGEAEIKSPLVYQIPATKIPALIHKKEKSLFSSIIFFTSSQIAYLFGVLKIRKKIDIIVIFPITMALPVIIGRILHKPMILYEAQDLLSMKTSSDRINRIKFSALILIRRIVLEFSELIIVEGRSIVSQNRIENFAKKIIICPQYVNTDYYFPKERFFERSDRVGFIGTLDERKGAQEFAEAIIHINNSDLQSSIKFLIVGKGPLSTKLKEILREEIKEGIVEFKGEVPEEDLPVLLSSCKLIVLPSKGEGLPNIILESMACGTPVLATRVGAIPEVIVDRETGFLMKADDAKEVASMIISSLRDPTLYLISQRARETMMERFSFLECSKRWHDIMDKL